jgi:single-stranded DNA-binding protein
MKAIVNLTGRLTRDVTNVFTNTDGTAKRCLLTIACNSYYKDQDGSKKESVDFVPCIAWGDGRVNTLSTWGKKGRHLHVVGTLETFQAGPDEKTGKYPPTKIQVRVEQFEFLDKKPEGVETPAQAPASGNANIDINAMAELVAQKLLNVSNANANTNDDQAQAQQAAESQASQGGGDLNSVV